MTSTPKSIIPETGERALLVGRTGSGKTGLACWLLSRMENSPIVIYDTKIEPKFEKLVASKVVENMDDCIEACESGEFDYVIVRPELEVLHDAEYLDGMLYEHYMRLHGVPAYIDEIYTFHINGRAGQGLVALLTRGRSKGITTIMSTQRPAWISRFCITESGKFYILRLIDAKDRKRFDDVIEDFSDLTPPAKFQFYYIDIGESEKPVLFQPVKLDAGIDDGYVSKNSDEIPKADDAANSSPDESSVWI